MSAPPSSRLVSTCTVTTRGNHDVVRVWNRGGLAGELVVQHGDGEAIRRRLMGPVPVTEKREILKAAGWSRHDHSNRERWLPPWDGIGMAPIRVTLMGAWAKHRRGAP